MASKHPQWHPKTKVQKQEERPKGTEVSIHEGRKKEDEKEVDDDIRTSLPTAEDIHKENTKKGRPRH